MIALAKFLSIDENELLALWLADKMMEVLEEEKGLSKKALEIILQNIKN